MNGLGKKMDRDPLLAPPPPEVRLPKAPLICVLSQVRFPPILAIDHRKDAIAEFQETIRGQYPFLERQEDQHLNISLPQQLRVETKGVWRFSDGAESWSWRLSLGSDFVAIETNSYETRADFLERFTVILDATKQVFSPEPATRLGLRYVNRLVGSPLARLSDFVRAPVLGLLDTPMGGYATHSLSETFFRSPQEAADLRLRQAFLPPGASIDPTIAPPIGEPSWLLDLDMSDSVHRPFEVAVLASRCRSFAERVYSVFREVVTEEFLRYHGGRA